MGVSELIHRALFSYSVAARGAREGPWSGQTNDYPEPFARGQSCLAKQPGRERSFSLYVVS